MIAVAIVGTRYWVHARSHESTDDAFIEGETIRISPQVSGHVAQVFVTDNQDVQTGQPLVQIDDRPYRAALEQARAQMRAAEAEASRARADAQRAEALFGRQLIARAAFDEARAADRTAAGGSRRRVRRSRDASSISSTRGSTRRRPGG